MSGDGAYAPKSPDLSTLYSIPAPAQAPSSVPSSIPSPVGGPAYHLYQPHHLPPHSPHQQLLQHQSPQRYASRQQSFPTTPTSYHVQSPNSLVQGGYLPSRIGSDPPQYSPPVSVPRKQQQDSSQDGAQPSSLVAPQSPLLQQPYQQQPQQYSPPSYGAANYQQYSPALQHPQQSYATKPALSVKTEPSFTETATCQSPEGIDTMPPKKSAVGASAPPAVAPSPVRTKFPTARIKRIMQADEEVGKVAQQTPIAVGKALEMFMVDLVSRSADVAREKSSRRVTAQMLKQVVESDDQWDFLREIVSKVEPEKEGSKAAKAKPETDDSDEEVEPKKKGRGGRKKKAA